MKDNQLLFDQDVAATWSDDVSKSCKVELTLTPDGSSSKAINSGDKLSEAGKLGIKVTDEAGNSSSAEIKLTSVDNGAPQISLAISEKNVVAGVAVTINDNRLLFNDQVAASWTDDYSTTLTTVLTLIPEGGQSKTLNSGDILFDAGKLTLSVADEANNKAAAEIILTAVAITGLENLQYLSLQVDHMVNLLEGVTITEGLTLEKVEVEQDGIKSVIPDAKTYTPEVPGLINIILTLGRSDGTTIEVRVDGLTVKGLDYTAPEMKTADIIQERYPWYNNLQQSTRDFIYPHLLASYAACNHSKQDNRVHIIMGETTDAADVENI